jgi:hypothetical protein
LTPPNVVQISSEKQQLTRGSRLGLNNSSYK